MTTEFALESRLKKLSPEMSKSFGNVVFTMERILEKTASIFPDFTDHTIRHSLFVMEYLNIIIGDQIEKLNVDEIYILSCAAYMHDFGMTVDRKNFDSLKDRIIPEDFYASHENMEIKDMVRQFHNEFSAEMILKYAPIFEFPSEEYVYCIAQVSKGHRRTDLFNEKEYNPKYELANGNTVCIPYLAALIRLCDELDITAERNSPASYLEHKDIISYRQHFAIKKMVINPDRFIVYVQTGEQDVREACEKVFSKLNEVLDYCIEVTDRLSDFVITQKMIEVNFNDTARKTAIVLDTDCGTDDAMGFALINMMGDLKPNYIIATPGNAALSQSLKNAIILKKLFHVSAGIVKGEEPEDIEKMKEKNTFHGNDGLANISSAIAEQLMVTEDELADYITMDDFCVELEDYDEIIYISICPLNSFSRIYKNEHLKNKFTRLFVMGGGINEFNCSHNTEFNFSKAPEAVKLLFASGMDITLFPLDLTNHQRLSEADLRDLESRGSMQEAITILEYNRQANIEYNRIDGAVMHDSMPMLFLIKPEQFRLVEKRLVSDEYGALREDERGKTVKVATAVTDGLMKEMIGKAIGATAAK